MKNIKTFGSYHSSNIKSNKIEESYDFSDERESSQEDEFNKICELLDENLIDYDYNDFERFYNLEKPEFDSIINFLLNNGYLDNIDESDIDVLSNDLDELMKEFK